MSHWNYRILRYADGGYGLHEVYYDVEGEKESWTVEPIGFVCDEEEGPEGIAAALRLALKDAEQRPVLQIDQTWAELVEEAIKPPAADKPMPVDRGEQFEPIYDEEPF